MSGATYRIELEHDPYSVNEWTASIYRLSDGEYIACAVGKDPEAVEAEARARVHQYSEAANKSVLYVFDDGTDAPAPDQHSVKA